MMIESGFIQLVALIKNCTRSRGICEYIDQSARSPEMYALPFVGLK